jgi:hypothetical protein
MIHSPRGLFTAPQDLSPVLCPQPRHVQRDATRMPTRDIAARRRAAAGRGHQAHVVRTSPRPRTRSTDEVGKTPGSCVSGLRRRAGHVVPGATRANDEGCERGSVRSDQRTVGHRQSENRLNTGTHPSI